MWGIGSLLFVAASRSTRLALESSMIRLIAGHVFPAAPPGSAETALKALAWSNHRSSTLTSAASASHPVAAQQPVNSASGVALFPGESVIRSRVETRSLSRADGAKDVDV